VRTREETTRELPMTTATHDEPQALKARPVRFDLQGTAAHWVPGRAFVSHFINVLHLLLPEGELWFCRVYNQALPLIEDPALERDVRGFIQQEAIHSKVHRTVLDHYFRSLWIDTAPYTDAIRWLFSSVLGERPLGLKLGSGWLARRWLLFRLGLIAALEHFTCVLGNWVLSARALDLAQADPVMLDLLRWHGAEEVEHRHVAHDLFVHAGGGFFQRIVAMALAGPILLGLWLVGVRYLMWEDRSTSQPLNVTWTWYWAARRGLLPSLWQLLWAALRYMRPGYHPRTEADTESALAYLASSPANLALSSAR
jgi:hypothetical protein